MSADDVFRYDHPVHWSKECSWVPPELLDELLAAFQKAIDAWPAEGDQR
jgi:hypothetical protein